MADTFDVKPADVARELPGMFPGGFTATSIPSVDDVRTLIATADVIATLRITDDVGQAPSLSDKASVLAKRYIVESVKAQVVRIVYGGNDPEKVDTAARAFESSATSIMLAIDTLGAQAIGTGVPAPRLLTSPPSTRELVLTDDDLDMSASSRGRF